MDVVCNTDTRWDLGSGTHAIHTHTTRRQRAVHHLQATASTKYSDVLHQFHCQLPRCKCGNVAQEIHYRLPRGSAAP